MFTPIVRFALIALSTIALIISIVYQNIPSALLYGAVAVVLVVGYYRNGTIWLAFQQLRRDNYEKMAKYLNQTKHPDRLSKSQKAYYHFLQGFLAIENEKFDVAQTEFSQAIETGLRTENEKAVAYLQLTDISLIQEDKIQAQAYLDQLLALKYKPSLEEAIGQIKEKMEDI